MESAMEQVTKDNSAGKSSGARGWLVAMVVFAALAVVVSLSA